MSRAALFDTCVVQHFLKAQGRSKWPRFFGQIESAIQSSGGWHISAMTAFELRRGLATLRRRGQGRCKAAKAEFLLRLAHIHELSDNHGEPWRRAAELYADGKTHKPAVHLSDEDLLIAATAIANDRELWTTDRRLYANLCKLGYEVHAALLALE